MGDFPNPNLNMAYTSLHLYRPGIPPRLTTADVVRFLECLVKLGLSEESLMLAWVRIKYGEAVDCDARVTHWVEPICEGIGIVEEIDWDVDNREVASIAQVMDLLSRSPVATIYRCQLGLGMLTEEVMSGLHRAGGDEPLYLNGLSFHLGPVTSYDYEEAREYLLGWIGVTLSGQGSLYPWKPWDLVERAEKMPQLEELRNLCRIAWPVEEKAPDSRVQHMREQMGDLWPYERLDKPMDWLWGVG